MRELGSTRLHRTLLVIVAALALLLLWILAPERPRLAAPSGATSPPRVAAFAVPPPKGTSTGGPSSDALVAQNPFSPRRAPPATAWRPGQEPPPVARVESRPPPLRLFGTVVGGTVAESFAVIEADPGRPGPELYRIGEAVGRYRLSRIFYGKVVLVGEEGARELALVEESVVSEGEVARKP